MLLSNYQIWLQNYNFFFIYAREKYLFFVFSIILHPMDTNRGTLLPKEGMHVAHLLLDSMVKSHYLTI